MSENFPSLEKLKDLPVHGFEGFHKAWTDENFKRKERGEGEPYRLLASAKDFAELVETMAGVRIKPRLLRLYATKLKLIPPPVQKDGADHYVYPDHLERLMMVLVLRKKYQLPLKPIRDLLEHLPAELRHVIISGKLTTNDALDLAKMIPKGFALQDLIMAKASEVMLEDVLSSDQALSAATEPDDALKRLEEERLLGRLEQMKEWIKSGRRQEFVKREAAGDFQDLAWKQRFSLRIRRKALAQQTRTLREELAGKK